MLFRVHWVFFNLIVLYNLVACLVNSSNIEDDVHRKEHLETFKKLIDSENSRLKFANYPSIYVRERIERVDPCGDAYVELFWVQDRTLSFRNRMLRLVDVIPLFFENLKKVYTGFEMAISGFSDRTRISDPKASMCHESYLNFTAEPSRVANAVQNIKAVSGAGKREDSLTAMYLASNWNDRPLVSSNTKLNETTIPRVRILFLITDAEGKAVQARVGKVDKNDDFNTENITKLCQSQAFPQITSLREQLVQHAITPVVLTYRNSSRFYNNLLFEWNIGGSVYILDSRYTKTLLISSIVQMSVCSYKCVNGFDIPQHMQKYFPECTYRHPSDQNFTLLPFLGVAPEKRLEHLSCSEKGCINAEDAYIPAREGSSKRNKEAAIWVAGAGSIGLLSLLFMGRVAQLEEPTQNTLPAVVEEREPENSAPVEREFVGNAELGVFV